ncbi:MAG: glutamine--fructose-6-phosphate transaminase (isomerizing) [candidate division Zixibacteria bacterium]|nr:glutamine--fructose-6-phosphate transaminase (isomerizing) [candidate division Zixibacteria bacterium]
MCGIVGYVGKKTALPILMTGLKRLEYRGYDSAGVALVSQFGCQVVKAVGKIAQLDKELGDHAYEQTVGIAHTRWATHGVPSVLNAHPHTDQAGEIALVHNGIIENYQSIREALERQGRKFRTETDTEALTYLIAEYYEGDLTEAVRKALSQVEGTYGIAVVSSKDPDIIVAARNGSPLIIGDGGDEFFVASDVSAVLNHTKRVVFLDDEEIVTITRKGYQITTIDQATITPHVEEISWSLGQIEKGGYDHFMLKEIHEQTATLCDAIRGRLNFEEGKPRLNGLNLQVDQLRTIDRIIICACGTSWHSGLIGEYVIEELARVPVEVEYASEFRYRSPIIPENSVFIAISQSGETADTMAALREAQHAGAITLGIVNVVGSSIARVTDGGVYTHSGPEIGVASTKAFTSQVMALNLIAILLGRMRNLSVQQGLELINYLEAIPGQVGKMLQQDETIKEIAGEYYQNNNFLYLGRGVNFPVALEGALKLKEISYIHAEGYPAAEMKHGPIALIDEMMPVVVIALKDPVYDKVISSIQQVKARSGRVIAIATEGDTEIASMVDHVIYVPKTHRLFTPVLSIIPLQLLAYHIAALRGCEIDQPRNLAKSVTVE